MGLAKLLENQALHCATAGTNLAIVPGMAGRRTHQRFSVFPSPQGVLRVLQDVIVHSRAREDMVVVTTGPGVLGEVVLVQSPDEIAAAVEARVLASQPIVIDGNVRHQLRLRQMSEGPVPEDSQAGGGNSAND